MDRSTKGAHGAVRGLAQYRQQVRDHLLLKWALVVGVRQGHTVLGIGVRQGHKVLAIEARGNESCVKGTWSC